MLHIAAHSDGIGDEFAHRHGYARGEYRVYVVLSKRDKVRVSDGDWLVVLVPEFFTVAITGRWAWDWLRIHLERGTLALHPLLEHACLPEES